MMRLKTALSICQSTVLDVAVEIDDVASVAALLPGLQLGCERRDVDCLFPDLCPGNVAIRRVEAVVSLCRLRRARLVLAGVERLGPLVPEAVFKRGVDGTVDEFPWVVVAAEDVVPEPLVGVEIDVRQLAFSFGLAQHRPEFGPGDTEPCARFWLVLLREQGLVQSFVDEPLSDRPAACSFDDGPSVGLTLDGRDAIVDEQVTDLQQALAIGEVSCSMFEDELHGVVVAVQHDLRLEALERRQAALAIEFLVERLGDLLAGVGVPASVRVGTRGALLRGVLVGCANRRGLEAVVFEAAGGEFADVLLDNSSGVLDVLEPVYVVATGLGNVPDGSVAWRVCTEF